MENRMLLKECKWERGRFAGKDNYGVEIVMDEFQVVDADELKRELSKCSNGRDVNFAVQLHSNGIYSSLWNWNFPEDKEEDAKYTATMPCSHEWVNMGFMSIKMACKHCAVDAPYWIQNKHDPQTW